MDRSGLDPDIATLTNNNKPLKFNPPLHPMSRPRRVDFGTTRERDMYGTGEDDYMKELPEAGNKNELAKFGKQSRLGRIIQSDKALGGGNKGKYKWGFRFMYNPTSIQSAVGMNGQVQLDPQSSVSLYLSAVHAGNLQAHTIPIVLNRIADLEDPDALNSRSYAPWPNAISDQDIKKIRNWGTMWDLEYLFRVCNGAWDVEDLGLSGNIGILQPNPAHLILGPGINHYGFVYSINYIHKRFTLDMVPTLTDVTIQFSRIVYVTQETAEEFKQLAGYYAGDFEYDRDDADGDGGNDSDDGGDSGGGDGGAALPPSGDAPTPSRNKIYNDPSIPHGGHAGGRVTNSTAYMFNEIWDRFGSGFTSAHCWRANGYGSPDHPGGHACDFIVSQGFASGASQAHGDKVFKYARDNARDLGICYIIWWNRIWNISKDSPTSLGRELGRGGSASNQHKDHVHISSHTSEDGGCM